MCLTERTRGDMDYRLKGIQRDAQVEIQSVKGAWVGEKSPPKSNSYSKSIYKEKEWIKKPLFAMA